MNKKIFIILSVLFITILTATISYAATNEMNNASNDVMNGVQDTAEDVKDGVQDTAETAENVLQDATGAVKDGTNEVEETGNNITGDMSTDENNGDYSATRTAATMGSNTTMWSWVLIILVAAAILGLVWYYTAHKNNSHEDY